nr:hypothetical protein BHI3_19100 [Bacteriovorax sp. HI3]
MQVILIILLSGIGKAFSFNWEKCKDVYKGSNNLITSSTAASGSTSSYISSTRQCSMNASTVTEKKIFFAYNENFIRKDIAKGAGEYLDAYAIISGCDLKTREYLPVLLQKNYVEIWGVEEKDTKAVYDSLEKIMNNDPKIKNGCNSRSNT